jgi:NTP pyrophosphatase (non-canonical NTP hydrolase)
MLLKELTPRIVSWITRTFGWEIYRNRHERGRRFLEEEVIELNQAIGLFHEEALRAVNHVYSRPVGQIEQEMGGVGITLLGLCDAFGLDFEELTERELDRVLALPADYFRKRNVLKAQAGIAMMPTGTD